MDPTLSSLYNALQSLTSVIWFAVPAGVAWYTGNNAITYNRNNHSNYIEALDFYDKHTFKKLVIPLYKVISEIALAQSSSKMATISARDKQVFLQRYETEKLEVIASIDFSSLETSLDFQDSQDKIIQSRKNQYSLKRTYRYGRYILIASFIVSVIHLLVGTALFIAKSVFYSNLFANIFLIIWISFLAIELALAIAYFVTKIRLDGYKNDQAN